MPNNAYDDLFQEAGQQYNVDPQLLKTIFHIESSGNPSTVDSSAGAQGGMQLMPDTAAYVGVSNPKDMKQAIPGAARYVAEGLDKTGSPEGALSYYFGGPDQSKWGPKTAGYVQKAQSLYPQMTVIGGTATPVSAQPPTAAVDPSFADRWGIGAKAPANDTAAPSPDFANRWGLQTPTAATVASQPVAAPIQTQQPSSIAAEPPQAPSGGALGVDPLTGEPMGPGGATTGTRGPAYSDPRYAGWDTAQTRVGMPTWAPPGAPQPTSPTGALSYSGITNALAPAPNTTYGDILPIARDNTTGALRFALPTGARDLAQGVVDLAQGPTSGTVTPKATMALTNMVPGLMRSPATGTGSAIAAASGDTGIPTSYVDRANVLNANAVRSAAQQNQLQAQAPLSAEFRNNPGVTEPQTVTGAAPSEPNPLAASSETRTPNSLSTPAAMPKPTATPSTADMTAQEAKEYAAIPDKLPPAPILPPLNQTAANGRADQLIQHFSTRNGAGANEDLIPGFQPTLAQKYNDPGLATLERGVQSVNPGPFSLRAESNKEAIGKFVSNLSGTSDDVEAGEAARAANTSALRDAAFANKSPIDLTPVDDVINATLAGPDGKRDAVKNTLLNVQKSLHVGGDLEAPLETDPEMAYGVRKHINDLLTPVAQRDNPQLQAASAQLSGLKGTLDAAIEPGAPGFGQYISKYEEMSRPIDQMKFLQSANLTDANGNVSLQKVDTLIKSIERQQNAPGVQKASSITDSQMADLNTLRNTLRAQGASAAGKALGSNTFQNLATNSRVGTATGNPLVSLGLAGAGGVLGGVPGAVAGAALNMGAHHVTGNAEEMTKNAILERLLNHQGKGDAVFAPKPTGPAYKGAPIPSMTIRPNPLSGNGP